MTQKFYILRDPPQVEVRHLTARISRIDVILRRSRARHTPRWERLLAHRNELLMERYEAEHATAEDDQENAKWRENLLA